MNNSLTITGAYAVGWIYISYVVFFVAFLYWKVKSNIFEIGYLALALLTPYSISIIPFRQDYLSQYEIYSNNDLLTFFFFNANFLIAPFYYCSLFVLVKNLRFLPVLHSFFFKWMVVISLFALLPLFYSYGNNWSELDRLALFFLPIKALLLLATFMFAFKAIIKNIDPELFVRYVFLLYVGYVLVMALALALLVPDWMVWIKYGLKYKFLDQTDQVAVFFFLLLLPSFFSGRPMLVLICFSLLLLLLLSGGKASVYYILAVGAVAAYRYTKLSFNMCLSMLLLAIASSWLVTYVVGAGEYDISMYTRYHQLQQLSLNYLNDPLQFIWGMGVQKSYYLFDAPEFFDPGAYIADELLSNYRIGFQTPFLDFIRNSGVIFGFGLLVSISISVCLKHKALKQKTGDKCILSFYLAASLFLLMLGYMFFPFWGVKTVMFSALFFVLWQRLESKIMLSK